MPRYRRWVPHRSARQNRRQWRAMHEMRRLPFWIRDENLHWEAVPAFSRKALAMVGLHDDKYYRAGLTVELGALYEKGVFLEGASDETVAPAAGHVFATVDPLDVVGWCPCGVKFTNLDEFCAHFPCRSEAVERGIPWP